MTKKDVTNPNRANRPFHSRTAIAVISFFALTPGLYIFWLIHKFGVNVPYWDEWEIATLLISKNMGTLSLHELNQQYNEHRLFFPNLILIAIAQIGEWNTKHEMYISAVFALLTSLALTTLLKITSKLPAFRVGVAAALLNLLLFSPIQSETWLTGIYLSMSLVNLSLAVSVLTLYLPIRLSTKMLVCATFCTVATFSLGNGLNSWIVISALFLTLHYTELKDNGLLSIIWITTIIVNLLIYLIDYHKPAHHPLLTAFMHNSLEKIKYFCALFGSPFGLPFGHSMVSVIIGAMTVGIFVALVGSIIIEGLRTGSWEETRQLAGWIAIGMFAFLTGAMIAVARSALGLNQALEERYIRLTMPLAISVCAILFTKLHSRRVQLISVKCGSLLVLVGIVALILNAWPEGTRRMAELRKRRQRGRAYLEFIQILPNKEAIEGLEFWSVQLVRERALALDKIRILNPRLIHNDDISQLAFEPLCNRCGVLNTPVSIENGRLEFSGWAELPYRGEPADLVLICEETDGHPPHMIAVVGVGSDYPVYPPQKQSREWRWSISAGSVAPRTKISAWAYDCYSFRAMKLSNDFFLNEVH